MEFFEAVQARQSVRSYLPQPVEAEKLQAVLAAANQSPSAGNLQPYKIYVVRDEAARRTLTALCFEQKFIAQAPLSLVFLADPAKSATKYGALGETFFSVQDTTVAVAYAQLAATAVGLATCWIGAFHNDKVLELIGAPPHLKVMAVLPLGYAAEAPARTTRLPLAEVVVDRDGPGGQP